MRRTLFNDSTNIFYFFSMILWPIFSLLQVYYNIGAFPISDLKILDLSNEEQLFYFIFIGYSTYIIFSNAFQSAWRLGGERYQGTLSQIFIAPLKKILWLYARTFSSIFSQSWFFMVIFVIGNFAYIDFSLKSIFHILLATIILITSSWIWTSFLSSICFVMRDATIVYVLLEGSQDTFSGAKVPLSISPKLVKFIGSLFPVSYTIIYLRDMLLFNKFYSLNFYLLIGINIVCFLLTNIILRIGESHMKKHGSFDVV